MVLENAPSWETKLSQEFEMPYMKLLMAFLLDEKNQNKDIYPPQRKWFYALEATPLDKVKVVILGQDPYHHAGQAHGLCFSVQPGIKVPPSLLNIYKELDKILPKCKEEFILDEFEMQILKGLLIEKMEGYNTIVDNEDYTRDVRLSKLKLNEFEFVKSLNLILSSEEVSRYIEMDFESNSKEKKKKRKKRKKS